MADRSRGLGGGELGGAGRDGHCGSTNRQAFPPGLTTLKTTQGQIDGFFSQFPFNCYLPEVASVGDGLEICPWVASRVVTSMSQIPCTTIA